MQLSQNVQETEFFTVLQTVEDIPIIENADFIYLNVVENFDIIQ